MAQNIKYKKSSLKDDASIYKKRDEDESEKSKWGRMDRRQRWAHFKTYYLRFVVIGCFVLILAGFFIYRDVLHRTEVIYRCALINEIAVEPPILEFADGFVESMNIDPERNQASFHLYYTNSEAAQKAGASLSSDLTHVSSLIYAGKLDSMIAGPEDLDKYIEKNFLTDLTELLTPEQLALIQDRLYIPDVPENAEKRPYGVYLDGNEVYGRIFEMGGGMVEKPVLSVMVNSQNKEASRCLLYYLFPMIKEN